MLCLWRTGLDRVGIPLCVGKTAAQLGLCQEGPRVLRLPDGLEAVGEGWFRGSAVARLVVSAGVRTLGNAAFAGCRGLR